MLGHGARLLVLFEPRDGKINWELISARSKRLNKIRALGLTFLYFLARHRREKLETKVDEKLMIDR